MKIVTSYKVRIKHYSRIFDETVGIYRSAVDFLIDVVLAEWDSLAVISQDKLRVNAVERMVHRTKGNPAVKYDFDAKFYKFPSYLRRAAIRDALGKASSYTSTLCKWKANASARRGKRPSRPRAGRSFPELYRNGCYIRLDSYTAKIKVFVRNTWDWITVSLGKTDVDYISRHCSGREELVPSLRKRGRKWSLDFPFQEAVRLSSTPASDQKILAVDLGINCAATASVMTSGGAVLDRKFLRLSREYDSLDHAVNRIKKAQQHGAGKTPALWAAARGINRRIAVLTAEFLIGLAVRHGVDVIVFECLKLSGRKKGSRKQRLQLWKARDVQAMVANKAHRSGIRIARVNARGTSRYAFDGSGRVLRGRQSRKTGGSWSVCEFQTGKVYNCDLNATYNIGARYFIREITKSLPATARLALEAKVPHVARRSTCTWIDLIRMNAALAA